MITESSFSGSLSQRIRRRYFYSPMASLFTVVVSAVIAFIVGKLVLWGLVNAVWTPDVQACGQSSGACWGFVAEKWRLIIFGRYPYHLQWRAAAANGDCACHACGELLSVHVAQALSAHARHALEHRRRLLLHSDARRRVRA